MSQFFYIHYSSFSVFAMPARNFRLPEIFALRPLKKLRFFRYRAFALWKLNLTKLPVNSHFAIFRFRNAHYYAILLTARFKRLIFLEAVFLW